MNWKNVATVASLLLTVSVTLFGQVDERARISVMGEAVVKIVPDELYLTLTVETRDKSMLSANRENGARFDELIGLFDSLKVPSRDVKSTAINANPVYRWDDGESIFLHFSAKRSVNLKIEDFSLVPLLLDRALAIGVTNVGQLQYGTSELRKHRDEARLLAVQAAKEKAEAMSSELDMRLSDPISINEQSSGGRYNDPFSQNVMSYGGRASEPSGSVSPGDMEVKASVSVVFQMEPR